MLNCVQNVATNKCLVKCPIPRDPIVSRGLINKPFLFCRIGDYDFIPYSISLSKKGFMGIHILLLFFIFLK